jgi:hypothetical protein
MIKHYGLKRDVSTDIQGTAIEKINDAPNDSGRK